MAESAFKRLARRASRGAGAPSERDWERSAVLEPLKAPRVPKLVSDGGGLSFTPDALMREPRPLDPEDPAVGALIAQLNPRAAASALWKRGADPASASAKLGDWRLLARVSDEALFALGYPPKMLTVAVKSTGRRPGWKGVGTSKARPLRAARDRIRASNWRLDPTHELDPEDTVLRVLVTEQTYCGAQRATGRVLPPDLYIDDQELILAMFVTPLAGFQVRAPNPETPVRVSLPKPVGTRTLFDGALYDPDDE